jgi:hypothetical protein
MPPTASRPSSNDHIEVRKLTDLDGLKRLAAEDPVALLRLVLLSQHRAATVDRIEGLLQARSFPPTNGRNGGRTPASC